MTYNNVVIEKQKPKFTILNTKEDVSFITFEKDGQLINASLVKNVKQEELVRYLNKDFTDKYTFLPVMYACFEDEEKKGTYCIIQEMLTTFDNAELRNKLRIDKLFGDLEDFQIETERHKLNINPASIMMRGNKEIVLVDLFNLYRDPEYWIDDNLLGNRKSLVNALLVLRNKDVIKVYVIASIAMFKEDKVPLSKYGLDQRIDKHYELYSYPISLRALHDLHSAVHVHKALKNYLEMIQQNIAEYKPQDSDNDKYWQTYNVAYDYYAYKYCTMGVIEHIVEMMK